MENGCGGNNVLRGDSQISGFRQPDLPFDDTFGDDDELWVRVRRSIIHEVSAASSFMWTANHSESGCQAQSL